MFSQCSQVDYKNDPAVLAMVGKQIITREQFVTRYQDVIRRTGLTDNMEARQQILNGIINEYLLIREALSRDLD